MIRNRLPKVYFLGSGKISIPMLEKLINSPKLHLVGVGTHVDRPSGRKRQMHGTPVGEWAGERKYEIDKIDCVNQPDFLRYVQSLEPDIVFVSSFGQILKQPLLDLPSVCCLNLHASLLPAYRGASPISAAILNSDKKTGITFMEMEKGLDTGPVFCYYDYILPPKIIADELEFELGVLGAEHVEEVVTGVVAGSLVAAPQNHAQASYAGKIHKDDGEIIWERPAAEIERMIRAYQPWPVGFFNFRLNGKVVHIKVIEGEVVEGMQGRPGEVVEADKNSWTIACGENALRLKRLIPQGRKEMSGADFMHGHRVMLGMNVTDG